MKYNELVIKRQRKTSRVGRGISGGRGKTAGRGTKGQGARKSTIKPGFEGGQMPIYMRLPKLRGFKSHRETIENVYTDDLDKVKNPILDNQSLSEAGLLTSPFTSAKLIQRGQVTSKKAVKLQNASAGAVKAVEKAGGSFEKTARKGRPPRKSKEP